MRITFVKTLLKLAKQDPNIFLITGDLGFMALEEFRDQLPKQYLNAGVSEQNMIAMSAGLALLGKKVYAYSIIPFVTMRPFEFIRNDVCYQNLNVKIIGIGAGFSYSLYGSTHHGIEDISIMRSLPNMTVVCPGDPLEVEKATLASVKHTGPMYIRLGKAGEPILHKNLKNFQLGKAIEITKGNDVSIIATSNILGEAVKTAEILREKKIKASVLSMHTIKPIDKQAIINSAKKTKLLITLEEHNVIGGLGSAVAEVLADNQLKIKFIRLGIPDEYPHRIGSQKFFREKYNLSAEKIVQSIVHALKIRS